MELHPPSENKSELIFARALSRDPVEEDGGLNIYGFLAGDPISQADGLGLECISIIKIKRGKAYEIATGVYVSYDIDGSLDKCDCCYSPSGNGKIEVGIGAKFEKKFFAGVRGSGVGGSVTAKLSLAKFDAGGSFAYESCPGGGCGDVKIPVGTLTVGPTASGEVSGGLHAGRFVNIDLYGSAEADLNVNFSVGVDVHSCNGHGSAELIGTLNSDMSLKADVYAKTQLWNFYRAYEAANFDWSLWNIGWTDEPLGTLAKW